MLANTPDYVADLKINVNGGTTNQRVAKKQKMSRWELQPFEEVPDRVNEADRRYKLVLVFRPDQSPVALDPQKMLYSELPAAVVDSLRSPYSDPETLLKRLSGQADKFMVENAGTAQIGGYLATRIRLTFIGEPGEIFFYFAKDLKNLFIKMEGGDKSFRGSVTFSNISLQAPDELFTIPAGYEKTDFESLRNVLSSKIRR
jgi:hypothetical protein